MSEHSITVEGGSSVRLKTAGKYCDRDIVVTSTGGGGGSEDLDVVLTEQEALIATLQETLKGKAAGGGTIEVWTFTMEDGSEITKEVVIA